MNVLYLLFLLPVMLFLAGCASDKAAKAARQDLRNLQTAFSQKAFIQSITDGDNNKVSLFLTGGIDTEIGQHNSNSLTIAVENNKSEIVELLLKHGVEINPRGFAGSPLCIAAAKGYADIAELLIGKKADINYLDGNRNPIMFAASAGHNDLVQLLLNAKADPNIQGESSKFSPLMLAARNGHIETVKLLLAKGADPKLLDHGGQIALTHAIFSGKTAVAELLIADKSYEPETDSTPALIMAISRGKINIAKNIIERGTDLNALVSSLPLLSWAIKNKHYTGAELLIKSGTDLNKADAEQMIPLDYALAAKNEKIIKMIRSTNPGTSDIRP
jgi:uncharacterized protein